MQKHRRCENERVVALKLVCEGYYLFIFGVVQPPPALHNASISHPSRHRSVIVFTEIKNSREASPDGSLCSRNKFYINTQLRSTANKLLTLLKVWAEQEEVWWFGDDEVVGCVVSCCGSLLTKSDDASQPKCCIATHQTIIHGSQTTLPHRWSSHSFYRNKKQQGGVSRQLPVFQKQIPYTAIAKRLFQTTNSP